VHWKWWLLLPPIIAVLVFFTYEGWGFWLSAGFFSLVLPLAFYFYQQDNRNLTAVMKPLAVRYGGTLRAGSPMSYPQLAFETNGRRCAVHAMPSGGANAKPGPFTSVRLTLSSDSGLQAGIRRTPKRVRGVVAALAPDWQATTGDEAFDQAFRLEGRDQESLAELLDAPFRARLLETQLPELNLEFRGGEIVVFVSELAKTTADLEEMIELAGELADRTVTPV